ncbi:hypothetical protein KSC_068450 [Ktedonobacter sp. SOSP1-52]|uniref:hypothetical protein n=1 Tax=Ktedonobacter sp. SOSP1-52 TaxID=2778366 RepID=UPI0019151F9F|nr:hypothetical protein [Ktedonobacter sp. SOSP1-52]GHO67953.1 hypothetical protein KSC_068450 [Ktedonobacter sp. SOSP1-52]
MYACLDCGVRLPPRAKGGHREREYCSDACRQRASRKRKKQEAEIARLIAGEYFLPTSDPHATRDRWLSERATLLHHCKELEAQRNMAEAEAAYLKSANALLEESMRTLESVLADKEAEITRLTILLESQSKRRTR